MCTLDTADPVGGPVENRTRCICSRCPSFMANDTGFFCVEGKSKLNPEERGCLCRTCPVHIECRLPSRAYCLRGVAKT